MSGNFFLAFLIPGAIFVLLLVQRLTGYVAVGLAQALAAVKKSFEFELAVTAEVANPFGYARQLVQGTHETRRSAFFYPHDTETAPWWQGENARLASLAAAARLAAPLFVEDHAFYAQLESYAWNQLHWILGRNPFDTSMLMGIS